MYDLQLPVPFMVWNIFKKVIRRRTMVNLLWTAIILGASLPIVDDGNTFAGVNSSDTKNRVPLQIEMPDSPHGSFSLDPDYYDEFRLDRDKREKRREHGVMIPRDATTNISRGKPVTSSVEYPRVGQLQVVTDGWKGRDRSKKKEKQNDDVKYLGLRPGPQWVQVNLESHYRIYAIAIWHYPYDTPPYRVYKDVVVQLSSSSNFKNNITTVFNNDGDGSLGIGKGKNFQYLDDFRGRVINVNGVCATHIRFYSNGNSNNKSNHWTEIEVYGKRCKKSAK